MDDARPRPPRTLPVHTPRLDAAPAPRPYAGTSKAMRRGPDGKWEIYGEEESRRAKRARIEDEPRMQQSIESIRMAGFKGLRGPPVRVPIEVLEQQQAQEAKKDELRLHQREIRQLDAKVATARATLFNPRPEPASAWPRTPSSASKKRTRSPSKSCGPRKRPTTQTSAPLSQAPHQRRLFAPYD